MALRIGVIGVGYLGQHHARIYSQMDEVQLIGILDIDRERTQEIAEQYNCDIYSDLNKLLKDIDALSIATPTPLHFEIAMKSLKSGKDILIEKPITETVEEADALIEEAEKRALVLQVGHLERFNPAVVALDKFITHPVFFESERLSPFLDRAAGVDVTLDLMIHDIDIILSLANSRPSYIKAVGTSVLSEKIDVAKAWIDFESGTSALITAGRLSMEKSRKLKIFQKDSHLVLDYQHTEIKRHYKNKDNGIMFEVIEPTKKEPLAEELKDFIRCIDTREKPLVSGREATNALSIALNITNQLKRSG